MDPLVSKASLSRLSMMRLVTSCALLAAAIAPAAVMVAWISGGRSFADVMINAAVATGVCWLAAVLSLMTTYLGQQSQLPLHGILVGMAFRMGLPLTAIIGLRKLGGHLAESGMLMTILGVYLVALVVETLLSLRMVPPQTRVAKAA